MTSQHSQQPRHED